MESMRIIMTGRTKNGLVNALFIAPYLALFLVWVALPAFFGVAISFTKWNIFTGEIGFVGLNNYLRVLSDDLFLRSLLNTFQYAALSVAAGNAVSFLLACGLAGGIAGRRFFQTIFFAPIILSIGVTGVIWGWLYNTDFGILNYWLQQTGLPRLNWLTNPKFAMISIVIMVIWAGAGFNMMIYLAGLLNIPKSYYEAAQLDGAGAMSRMIHITLPLMKHTFAFTLIISTIGAFQVFDQPYILTGGGPDYATYTYVYHIYSNGFRYFRMGYASALSCLLAAVIALFSFIQYKMLTRRRVDY